MATITATGEFVVLDETYGLQNDFTSDVAGDLDDNDILTSRLPTALSGRLTFYGVTLREAALSGYGDGTNATDDVGDSIVTISAAAGSEITDVSLAANAAGDPFPSYEGTTTSTWDSGLSTLDGTEIFLFADPTDDNIVYGVAGDSATGDVVFAVYLEEVEDADGNVTAGKMWTVLADGYTLQHPGDTDPDDSLDLTGKLYVAANEVLEFGAANAPSGQNLFITFAATDGSDHAIVVTGKAPANQSTGANTSTGDTVNTSQVTDTTFGSNDQMLKPASAQDPDGNGLWFTFVTDPNPDYTVPNLTATEANIENNIDYGGAFSADSASFDVVQLQSGSSAKVKITAVNSTNTTDQTQYVDGILADLAGLTDNNPATVNPVDITSVTLSGAQTGSWSLGGADQSWLHENGDGSVTLSGILAGTTITYDTDGTHNRVLIENGGFKGGQTNAAFDIGGFTILSTSTDAVEIGSKVQFEDDGPAILVSNATGDYDSGAHDGTWTHDPGTDGFQLLSVTLNSYAIDDGDPNTNDTVTVNTSLTATTADPYAFTGSITDDFNGDNITEKVDFTLTFDPAAGTYDLDVTTPPGTITTFDTTQGSLKAGGPDAVQTLQFPPPGHDNDVVFFSVLATAPLENGPGTDPNDVEDLVRNDPTEAQLEALSVPTLINSSSKMNVSTSGIGVNNNNLDGSSGGTALFAGTSITSGDESFVVNPVQDVDKVTVYIDNSVGGYNPATEDLYYIAYYTDGTVSGPTDVTVLQPAPRHDPLIPDVAEGGKYFVIDGGANQIEAVQFIMGAGSIKIPVIQFTIEQEFNPAPLDLDFTADLLDGDNDNISDTFSIHLDVADGIV